MKPRPVLISVELFTDKKIAEIKKLVKLNLNLAGTEVKQIQANVIKVHKFSKKEWETELKSRVF